MATFKLNMARIKGAPKAAHLVEVIRDFGKPERDAYAVMDCDMNEAGTVVTGHLARKSTKFFSRLDDKSGEIVPCEMESVKVYPFIIKPDREILQTLAGTAGSIKDMAAFLSGGLGLSTVVEDIEVDILAVIDELAKQTNKFSIKKAKASDYAANSYIMGTYTPGFMDSEHGKDFMEQHAEALTAATVRFQCGHGRVTVQLRPTACFSFSCHEDDAGAIRKLLESVA